MRTTKSQSPAPAPRAKRIPAAEIRSRMLATARTALRADGLRLSFDNVPMEEYIRTAGVPRSSVYRMWNTREEFVADVIEHLFAAEEYQAGFDTTTQLVARTVLAENAHLMQTREGRREVFREMIRLAADANIRSIGQSADWSAYAALFASLASAPEGPAHDAVERVVRGVELRFNERMTSFYSEMLRMFEVELAPGVTARHLAIVGNVLLDGLQRRRIIDGEIASDVVVAPGIGGEPVEWSFAAFSLASLIEGFVVSVGPEDALGDV